MKITQEIEVKVYCFAENGDDYYKTWIAASSVAEAVKEVYDVRGLEGNINITEVPEKELKELKHIGPIDNPRKRPISFLKELERQVKKQSLPFILAITAD